MRANLSLFCLCLPAIFVNLNSQSIQACGRWLRARLGGPGYKQQLIMFHCVLHSAIILLTHYSTLKLII